MVHKLMCFFSNLNYLLEIELFVGTWIIFFFFGTWIIFYFGNLKKFPQTFRSLYRMVKFTHDGCQYTTATTVDDTVWPSSGVYSCHIILYIHVCLASCVIFWTIVHRTNWRTRKWPPSSWRWFHLPFSQRNCNLFVHALARSHALARLECLHFPCHTGCGVIEEEKQRTSEVHEKHQEMVRIRATPKHHKHSCSWYLFEKVLLLRCLAKGHDQDLLFCKINNEWHVSVKGFECLWSIIRSHMRPVLSLWCSRRGWCSRIITH